MVEKLASEKVVVSAPMSFSGSATRIWKITDRDDSAKWLLVSIALSFVFIAWWVILIWYCIFGLFLVPYRLIRRGSRKRQVQNLRHRETLEAINKKA
jgi:hypothetical protein